jgi:hypothetical protein
MSDMVELNKLEENQYKDGYDYYTQERTGFNKRDSVFQNYKVPRQYWQNIKVNYTYFPLREKYNV